MRFSLPNLGRLSVWHCVVLVCASLTGTVWADPANTEQDAATPPADTLVICPPEFIEAMRPWFAHRTAQGHEIGVVTDTDSSEKIRETIRHTAQSGHLKTIVLVGDIPLHDATGQVISPGVPTHRAQAKVNVLFGSEPHLATDNWYADLTDDGVPELAVGRLSCRDADQLKVIVAKTLAYENQATPGAWQRNLNFVAGVGGFGTLIDSMLEGATKKFLTDEIPPHFHAQVAYGSWQSPYCPDPREFRDEMLRQLNEGSLFWVYMGHGHPQNLDQIQVPGGQYPILSLTDVPLLRNQSTRPIAIFLSCYSGAFDATADCLAEHMVRAEGGPVAALAGSRVTMPYAMSVMGTEMLGQFFRERPETLGELILLSKREMVAAKENSGNRKMLDLLARMVSPKPGLLEEERREHVALFNLLGDPLLRLSHPELAKLEVAETASAGSELVVRGSLPISGKVRLELVCRRDGYTEKPPVRREFSADHDHLSGFNATYHQANNHIWTDTTFPGDGGTFEQILTIPAHCLGACYVRVLVEGEKGIAVGSQAIEIGPAGKVAGGASEE